jgi:two-component system nitrogen regulation sensor histidine kinase NtrY
MDAVTEPVTVANLRKRWFTVTPAVEVGVLALAVAIALATWTIVARSGNSAQLLTPPVVALLLVANLLTCGSLIVLVGRRVAKRRAAAATGGEGQLHVRLVAIFSVLATVPTVLLAVIASLLFQYGAEFWFSNRSRAMLENTQQIAQESYKQLMSYVDNENIAMANDLRRMLVELRWSPDSREFAQNYAADVYQRSLANSVLFAIDAKGEAQTLAIVKNSDRNPMDDVEFGDIKKLQSGGQSVVGTNAERTYSLTRVLGTDLYLYSTRETDAREMADRVARVRDVGNDYQAMVNRARTLQLQFNIALLVISLIVIGIVVFIALAVADRLVRPINALVGAARRVAEGDLTARVTTPQAKDEVAILGDAFNQMTSQLQSQTNALVTANAQIESRRALIEAVMSGVTAGVISVDADRNVRLINASAMVMLRHDEGTVGGPLAEIAPELDAMLDGVEREAVIQVTAGGEARTLAVKITRDEGGQVLTFDDITQQLLDQRRAAWSDVARRIAHEIKNPLTPIQLAAERLQRKYGKANEGEKDGTFARLTDTIVRQVGDLRRIVDEFSSFARMPKPLFRQESLLDIARQSMFLHEVAHPAIRFEMDAQDATPIVSDRRQIGQALTNVVKNAVEAIEARPEGKKKLPQGEIVLTIRHEDRRVLLSVADNGIGLPVERDRIAEPYMTTRERGTGLGLAIVKKIIEEHFGTIAFADRKGGGTVVTICFDTEQLAGMASEAGPGDDSEPRPAALTRTGTKS